MSLIKRASKLLQANVNHLMDTAEDPEVMLKQLLHDMNESIVGLRRETVNAVAREKQLEKKVRIADTRAAELEDQAALALDHNDRDLARRLLGERVDVLKRREGLADEKESASTLATQLKHDLVRMEKQARKAQDKKDELIRRKRAAEAQLRTQDAAQRSVKAMSDATGQLGRFSATSGSFNDYADEIGEIEARAEAARELAGNSQDDESKLRDLEKDAAIDDELERLVSKRRSG